MYGQLLHRSGTAELEVGLDGKHKTHKLSSLAGDNVCFVKIDTDGFDCNVITFCYTVQRKLQYLSTICHLGTLNDQAYYSICIIFDNILLYDRRYACC